jgi:purine nucleoside phosphorylase
MRSKSAGVGSSWNAPSTAVTKSGMSSVVMGVGSTRFSLCCSAMPIGIITGSGTYALPGFESSGPEPVATQWGEALVSRGTFAGADVLHVSRHGEGHVRLSNQVTHRANIAALAALGADGVLAVTVCGAVDPTVELGSLTCFDDLHFVGNRLGNGELCTFYPEAGDPRRGHWIFEDPFSHELRRALLEGAREAGVPVRDGGCYGHVDGPRFNTRAEIRGLAACGVTHVSQTGGPEAVLCGEAELPYALLGYATDYANGVKDEATPVQMLLDMMAASTSTFAAVLAAAVPRAAAADLPATGTVYRFESG